MISDIIEREQYQQFPTVITKLQSPKNFKETAHRLVHTENILLYAVNEKTISLPSEGIRFFTLNDMCENCENIVYLFANNAEFNQNPFYVLSSIEYEKSRDRNLSMKQHLLKVAVSQEIFTD